MLKLSNINDKSFKEFVNSVYENFNFYKERIIKQINGLIKDLESAVLDIELCGSYGRKSPNENSDIDILVKYYGKEPEEDVWEKLVGKITIPEIPGICDVQVRKEYKSAASKKTAFGAREWWNKNKSKFRNNLAGLISIIGISGLLAIIGSGYSKEEIAQELNIPVYTIEEAITIQYKEPKKSKETKETKDVLKTGDVDIQKIIQIESGGNPAAHNKRTDARGLMQITPIALKDWNNEHPDEQYTPNDLWIPIINVKIGIWLINIRAPQFLGEADSIKNRLIVYHDGIGNFRKYQRGERELGVEMIDYIQKYGN